MMGLSKQDMTGETTDQEANQNTEQDLSQIPTYSTEKTYGVSLWCDEAGKHALKHKGEKSS